MCGVCAAADAAAPATPRQRKHPDPENPIDPGKAAAESIVEHLERSRYEVRKREGEPRGHRTP